MPVGIPDRGMRECDQLARKRLSPYRTSSVFSAPIRPVLSACDYRDACNIHERHDGRRMSKQAFFIMPRIVELDTAVRADTALGSRLYEIHPELSFAALNGGTPMKHAKRNGTGFDCRYALLTGVFDKRSIEAALNLYPRQLVARDDVLDAFAVLWSASRIANGDAVRLPEEPRYDAGGIDMAIWH